MKLCDVMTDYVIRTAPEETVDVAARTMAQHNIGAMPVCGADGKLLGMVTDRDLVIRCVAANRDPAKTKVGQVMTGRVLCADSAMEVTDAARLMGREQIRRLPVVEKGRLCGMVTLGDLAARQECRIGVADALGSIAKNQSFR